MEHPRLLIAPNGKIFIPGPTNRMQWYDVAAGTITSAGNRGDDEVSQNDITVMFDVGKILKAGGNISYDRGITPGDGTTRPPTTALPARTAMSSTSTAAGPRSSPRPDP